MRKLFILLLLTLAQTVPAQIIKGIVVDEESGDTIPHTGVQYKNDETSIACDRTGHFAIERRNGEYLTFSAVGYKTLSILIGPNTPPEMRITLKAETKHLQEVTIKAKRGKYSRKNNPAVELMKRVIAAKKRTDLANHDHYQFNKYQKLTFAINDINPATLEKEKTKKKQWLLNQIEM